MPKCLFHVTSIGVTSCSWNLVFAIFGGCVFCCEMFGWFKDCGEGLRRCLKGRAKNRESEEGKRERSCIKHLGRLKLRLSMAGWSRKILQL